MARGLDGVSRRLAEGRTAFRVARIAEATRGACKSHAPGCVIGDVFPDIELSSLPSISPSSHHAISLEAETTYWLSVEPAGAVVEGIRNQESGIVERSVASHGNAAAGSGDVAKVGSQKSPPDLCSKGGGRDVWHPITSGGNQVRELLGSKGSNGSNGSNGSTAGTVVSCRHLIGTGTSVISLSDLNVARLLPKEA